MDGLANRLKDELEVIHKEMFENAVKIRESRESYAENWEEFMNCLNMNNLILTPWCENIDCEINVKERSGLDSKDGCTDE